VDGRYLGSCGVWVQPNGIEMRDSQEVSWSLLMCNIHIHILSSILTATDSVTPLSLLHAVSGTLSLSLSLAHLTVRVCARCVENAVIKNSNRNEHEDASSQSRVAVASCAVVYIHMELCSSPKARKWQWSLVPWLCASDTTTILHESRHKRLPTAAPISTLLHIIVIVVVFACV
jgi:hypothetical protein